MFRLLAPMVEAVQPFLVPICFVSAWLIVSLAVWSVFTATRDGVQRSRRLHQIPCTRCRFFTEDYHLKCTVRPHAALTEEAIGCGDFVAGEGEIADLAGDRLGPRSRRW